MLPRATTPDARGASAGLDVRRADDRLRVEVGGGVDAGRERAVDRLGEGVGPHGVAVAEAEAPRSLNVYVLPSAETVGGAAATSGTSW